jgi:hypothetical protein
LAALELAKEAQGSGSHSLRSDTGAQAAATDPGPRATPLLPPPWAPRAAFAAAAGQLAVLQWLVDSYGAATLHDTGLWSRAAQAGAAAIIPIWNLLMRVGCPEKPTAAAAARALQGAGEGATGAEVLAWLQQHGCELAAPVIQQAAVKAGSLQLLSRLPDRGRSKLTSCLWKSAVEHGRAEVLQWLYENGCPLPEERPACGTSEEAEEPAQGRMRREDTGQLFEAAIRQGDFGVLWELWQMVECDRAWSASCRSVGIGRVGVAEFKRMRAAAFASPYRNLPLIRFVLLATTQPPTDESSRSRDPALQGWCSVKPYELQGVAGDAVTAAMFDHWAEKVIGLASEHVELVRLANGVSACGRLRSVNGLGDSGSVGAQNMRASIKLLGEAAEASVAELREMVEQVMEWEPDEGEDSEDGGDTEDSQE